MNNLELTPSEAMFTSQKRPTDLAKVIDMFLSRNEFDPRNAAPIQDPAFEERMRLRWEEAERISTAAEESRKDALKIIQRTNDISDTLKKIRG